MKYIDRGLIPLFHARLFKAIKACFEHSNLFKVINSWACDIIHPIKGILYTFCLYNPIKELYRCHKLIVLASKVIYNQKLMV